MVSSSVMKLASWDISMEHSSQVQSLGDGLLLGHEACQLGHQHGALVTGPVPHIAQTSKATGVALHEEVVKDTASRVSVPHIQDVLTPVNSELGTDVVLHQLDLLGNTLGALQVAGEVLDGGLALITGDCSPGHTEGTD